MEDRNPTRLTVAEGRRFGLTVGGAFLLLAAFFFWRKHTIPLWITGSFGASFALAGLVVPTLLGPVQDAWMRFAVALSKVTNPIVMGLIYYTAITPTGILRRVFGGNPLDHRNPDTDSYWRVRTPDDRKSDMHRQF